jgi:hypothetical protein
MQKNSSKAVLHGSNRKGWVSCLARTILLFVLAFAASGCASALTTVSRPYTKDVRESTRIGEEISSYKYVLRSLPPMHTYQLHRNPLCAEMARMKKISRKQPRGFILALAEMPLYGLGLLDWLYAKSISRTSEKVLDTWQEPTSKLFPCGPKEPAPHEVVVLQTPRRTAEPQMTVKTDEQGKLRLRSVLRDRFRFGLINMFVLCEGDLKYVRSFYL